MLSQSAEYALRIMAFFALHHGGTPLRARDIAKEINIPLPYLSKILRHMVNARLLSASRGHGGGFLIARSPAAIRFTEILAAVNPGLVERRCVFGWDVCSDRNPCILHHRWRAVRASFEEWASTTTLESVIKDASNIPLRPAKGDLRKRIRAKR